MRRGRAAKARRDATRGAPVSGDRYRHSTTRSMEGTSAARAAFSRSTCVHAAPPTPPESHSDESPLPRSHAVTLSANLRGGAHDGETASAERR